MATLTSLYGETVAGVGELVWRCERTDFHPVRRARFKRSIAVATLIFTVFRANGEVLHRAVFERIIRLHHLRQVRALCHCMAPIVKAAFRQCQFHGRGIRAYSTAYFDAVPDLFAKCRFSFPFSFSAPF
jgi:hypothetical protein